MTFEPYWQALALAPLYLPIEYGPLLILGLWGFRLCISRSSFSSTVPLLALLTLGLLQMFLMATPAAKTLGILKGNRLLPVVFLIWTGFLFDKLFLHEHLRKHRLVAMALVCAAIPTFFTDIYFTSNVKNPLHTRYVRVADREACDWIRSNTPPNAIVQGEPEYLGYSEEGNSGENHLSLIASFGERRQILGAGGTVGTVENAQQIARSRREDLHSMFNAKNLVAVVSTVKKYRIDYLYVGPYERELYPEFLGIVRNAPNLFREVYNKDGVYLFERAF